MSARPLEMWDEVGGHWLAVEELDVRALLGLFLVLAPCDVVRPTTVLTALNSWLGGDQDVVRRVQAHRQRAVDLRCASALVPEEPLGVLDVLARQWSWLAVNAKRRVALKVLVEEAIEATLDLLDLRGAQVCQPGLLAGNWNESHDPSVDPHVTKTAQGSRP